MQGLQVEWFNGSEISVVSATPGREAASHIEKETLPCGIYRKFVIRYSAVRFLEVLRIAVQSTQSTQSTQ
jgi:hypothetical protein